MQDEPASRLLAGAESLDRVRGLRRAQERCERDVRELREALRELGRLAVRDVAADDVVDRAGDRVRADPRRRAGAAERGCSPPPGTTRRRAAVPPRGGAPTDPPHSGPAGTNPTSPGPRRRVQQHPQRLPDPRRPRLTCQKTASHASSTSALRPVGLPAARAAYRRNAHRTPHGRSSPQPRCPSRTSRRSRCGTPPPRSR